MGWIFVLLGVLLLLVGIGVGWVLIARPDVNIPISVNGRTLTPEERSRSARSLGWVFGGIMGGIGAVMLVVGIVLIGLR